jgi:1-acyl-sn-glycerol-3-phosphate acyltransferase
MTPLRAAFRLVLLTGLVLASLPSGFASRTPEQRARWMQRIAHRILRVIGGRVEVRGAIPTDGLIVSNHLGYLDVFVIGSALPAIFVAKSDVRGWPVIGLLCRLAGTIFVERGRRTSVGASLPQIHDALDAGLPVVLFPEGTSSDGATLLPFKTSLFEPAAHHRSTPAAIAYELPGGSVADELCYWRDMVFAPHFWNVLGKRGFVATLRFGEPSAGGGDRKRTAAELHAAVARLCTPKLVNVSRL